MIKKTFIQFLLIYILIAISLVGVSFFTNLEYTKQLKTANKQLLGVEYLRELYLLSSDIAQYLQYKSDSPKAKQSYEESILHHITTIYAKQKKFPLFKNVEFNQKLEEIKRLQFSKYRAYTFIDEINKENYKIGDKSELLFEENRKLYFLGTLVTHYMPEYLLSSLIVHGIVEEFITTEKISKKDEKIFIEQNKLIDLSFDEIESIITLLKNYTDTIQLYNTFNKIKKIIPYTENIFENGQVSKKYIYSSHQLLKLSYKLNDKTFDLIRKNLEKKQNYLQKKISTYKIIFFTLIILFTIIMFLYYRSTLSNLKKDLEIQDINEVLDQFVIFSKTSKDGEITYVSSAFEKISGYTKEESIGQDLNYLTHEDMDENMSKELWKAISSKSTYIGEVLNKAKDGTSYWVQEIITPKIDEEGEILNFTNYMVNITNKKKLEVANKKLEALSIYDPLTQTYNRLKLDMLTHTLYESYKRYKKIFSIILIDIDFFKNVNDEFGHLVGDEVLKTVANLIKTNIRESDHFGRWGGEEFLIICELTNAQEAYILAEKIRKIIESHKFGVIGTRTISLGVSQIEDNLTIKDLLNEADQALYQAKNSGRNRTVLYKNKGKK